MYIYAPIKQCIAIKLYAVSLHVCVLLSETCVSAWVLSFAFLWQFMQVCKKDWQVHIFIAMHNKDHAAISLIRAVSIYNRLHIYFIGRVLPSVWYKEGVSIHPASSPAPFVPRQLHLLQDDVPMAYWLCCQYSCSGLPASRQAPLHDHPWYGEES